MFVYNKTIWIEVAGKYSEKIDKSARKEASSFFLVIYLVSSLSRQEKKFRDTSFRSL